MQRYYESFEISHMELLKLFFVTFFELSKKPVKIEEEKKTI